MLDVYLNLVNFCSAEDNVLIIRAMFVLTMGAVSTSETSVNFCTARCHRRLFSS
jgi:hypothetical protein